MFKKSHDLAQRSKSHMKNKDVRNLKKDVKNSFPTFSESQLGELLMDKGNVTITKLASRTLIYSMDNIPYFIDIEARSTICPTVFTLWRVPHLLRVVIIHPQVSGYILNGADLMAPGIIKIEDCSTLSEGELVSIRVLGNSFPFAVGRADMGGDDFIAAEEGGTGRPKGKAVTILHAFGDLLWLQCRDQLAAGMVRDERGDAVLFPNAGFGKGLDLVRSVSEEDPCDWGAENGDSDNEVIDMGVDTDGKGGTVDAEDTAGVIVDDSAVCPELTPCGRITVPVCPLSPSGNVPCTDTDTCGHDLDQETDTNPVLSQDPPSPPAAPSLSKEQVDELFTVAALRVLRYAVTDSDLPLRVSTLWSQVSRCVTMLSGLETRIDIRASSFGKASSFLSSLQSQGVLQLGSQSGESGDGALEFVQAVFVRQHELLRTHAEAVRVESPEEFRTQLSALAGRNALDNQQTTSGGAVDVHDLYRFSKPMRGVLSEEAGRAADMHGMEGQYGECLTNSELQRMIMAYVASRALTDPLDKKYVVFPPSDGLYVHLMQHKGKSGTQGQDKEVTKATPLHHADDNQDKSTEIEDVDEEDEWCEDVDRVLSLPAPPSDGEGRYRMVAGVLVATTSTRAPDMLPSGAAGLKEEVREEQTRTQSQKKKPVFLPPRLPAPLPAALPSRNQSNKPAKKAKEPTDPNATPEPLRLSKEDLLMTIKKSMSKYHVIVFPSGEYTVSSGSPPKVLIEAEMRTGSKVVTKVHGLEAYGLSVQKCSREFQKRFACSAAVTPVAGRPDDVNIVVQGNWVSQLENYLLSVYRIPRKVVVVHVGKNVKVKKSKK